MLNKTQRERLRLERGGPNRLSKAMELAGLTQEQVAERTGFTQSYVSKVKTGAYADLPGETMRTFAACFNCNMDDLFPPRKAVA